jgi:hypothetical protein
MAALPAAAAISSRERRVRLVNWQSPAHPLCPAAVTAPLLAALAAWPAGTFLSAFDHRRVFNTETARQSRLVRHSNGTPPHWRMRVSPEISRKP